MSHDVHHYSTHLTWDGNHGDGTTNYTTYGREHRIAIDGKPVIEATSDPAFRGDPAKLNPEDLFVASLSSCHMLAYLALCAKYKINVIAYEDHATGTMRTDARGGGKFEEVTLHPVVTIADASQAERAKELHERAHELCFIASSVAIPVHHKAEIRS